MHRLGIPVVCIERDVNARGIAAARSMELPVLVGEAPLEDQLRRARVHRCRAVLALTGDDAANLEAALEARALAPDVRIVLRLFDDDFATQVYRTFTNAASRSVSYLAAPAFAAALMGREVLGTLSVYRHVVLIAEFVAEEGSDLVGRTLHEIEVPGEVRVIAVRSRKARDYLWRPDHGRHISVGDTYVLLATRAGLGRHTSRVS
jgi:Trk K+ transport system NAD-binding subunit